MRLNVSHNSTSLSNHEQSSFVIYILKSPIMIRLSNLFTALLKEIVNLAKKVSIFEEVGGLYTLMQNHLFLDMVISVQIVWLRFVSRSLSLFILIPFFKQTQLIHPHFYLFPFNSLFYSPLLHRVYAYVRVVKVC